MTNFESMAGSTLRKRTRQPGIADPKTVNKSSSGTSKLSGTARTSSASTTKEANKLKSGLKTLTSKRNTLKIGVDYGTTYTGVTIAETNDGDLDVLDEWPGSSGNARLEKVPSKIAFKEDNHGQKDDKWGNEVKPEMKSYSWTKLLLNTHATQEEFDSDILSGAVRNGLLDLPEGKTAQQVVTAYLKKLYQHIMDYLRRTKGATTLKITPIDFWFTVPATWDESSIDATSKAAYRAGFGTRDEDELLIITEPEAAAIAILNQKSKDEVDEFKTGSNILVADLGGGTLDFQCLTIEGLEPLRTEETIVGVGAKSGSTYIDCNLHGWLERIFGADFTNLPLSKTGPGSALMRDFETIKKIFTGEDMEEEYGLAFPTLAKVLRDREVDTQHFDADDGEVRISASDLAAMFQPVLDAAFGLLDKLLASLKKAKKQPFNVIVLCGGLGSSKFVWKEFNSYCNNKLKNSCSVLTDKRAWSAVARGAATRGLEGSIVLSRKAKRWYGIGVHQEFQEGVDDEEDAFQCPVGGKRAEGYVKWIVKKGQAFTPNFRADGKVYVPIEADDDPEELVFNWQLYSCATQDAPARVDQKNVEEIGTIKLSLSKTHKRRKVKIEGDREHESANLKIVMKLGNEKGLLMVEALHNRKCVGTAKIDYGKTHIKRAARSAGLR